MKRRLLEVWQQLRTSFSVEESPPNTAVDAGKAVLAAAQTVKKQGASVEALKYLLRNSSSLLDVLCSPLTQVLGAGLPFLPMGIALVKFSRAITKQDPTLEDCVFIVSQAAYLESAKEILSIYPSVNWDDNANIQKAVTKQLQKLNEIELDYQTASNAIACFHESELAKAFNQVLLVRLLLAKIPKNNANLLTKRVAWNTHRYMIQAWLELGDAIKNVIKPSLLDWQNEQQQIKSIDEYLKNHIATKPLEHIFNEPFSFKDIYVPLKAKSIDKTTEPLDLETWAKTILLKQEQLEQVMFIQGKSGSGKSVFCRMFADWVRKHLYPIWIPILIRLGDIDSIESRLEKTLETEIKLGCIQIDNNWLTNNNIRFLFILDGLDELHFEARDNLTLESFIKQVTKFQQQCKYGEMGHRVLITSKSMSLKGIHQLPSNLERMEIVEMDGQLQQKWFSKWEAVQINPGNATLGQFLQSEECPSQVQKLAQEPLLLYLLAAMYRDGKLVIDRLEQATQQTAKTIIYQEALEWVLAQPYERYSNNFKSELTKYKPEDLKRLLSEAAVCIVQSRNNASISMLEARLEEDETAKALIKKAKGNLGKEALKTAWANFYITSVDKEDKIEFFHQSFSEFLFAERLRSRLKVWTQEYLEEGRKQLITSEAQMNWQIYDLLGFGELTPQIVEYIMELLIEIPDFPWEQLFKRLENFYHHWCQGKFIDSAEETLPQKKLRQLQKYGIRELGQRQVDIYAGLNVMILLLELHRYAQNRDDLKKQITFYPSGQPKGLFSIADQLLLSVNYSDGIQLRNFTSIVGQFLSHANLSDAYLRGVVLSHANLSQADFSRANLSYANLSDANLSYANLSRTNLSDANLSRANLSDANLSDANLSRAGFGGANLSDANLSRAYLSHLDLSGANLSGANLSMADLNGANLSHANLENIFWDEYTNWENTQGLYITINMPAALKQQLGLI
ncbi:low-complexity protein [Nostoc minutum NIES-26]|uniref:Low-complexity protein n=1 Tax=Nostoc minutum NIES-26 TaxID=1844469 RepID=A0A367QYX0_9NOSO|nr:low-complexity protein [Nostoc minutum NIES-26]